MVRFGIVGFGLHAVKRLMPGFAQAKRCRVTALSRRDLQRAKESARQFEIEHAFASTAELCARFGGVAERGVAAGDEALKKRGRHGERGRALGDVENTEAT